jgi:hypothetical protein
MKSMGKQSGRSQLGVILTVVLVLLVPAGCGGHDAMITSASQADPAKRKQGPLKPIHWGIIRVSQQSVKIGAFVPYCEYTKPVPHIERVTKQRFPGRIILTMLVQFPPRRSGCLGVQISVGRWVKIGRDPLDLKFFDGKTSPPKEVQVGE